MFTCLEILPESEGFFTKIYEKIKPPEPEREYIQVKGATPFLRLKVKENNIDWRKISACLSNNERIILTDNALEFPEKLNLKRYNPASLSAVLMFKTMCQVLKMTKASQTLSLSVFDKNGHLSPYIEKLVPLVRNASVYTEKIREYFLSASRIMEMSGMSIKINEYESPSPPEKIIFADEYLPSMKNADLVFLADSSVISYNTVTGHGIFLENEYKILKSELIDDFSFASALYELNNARFFDEREFTELCLCRKSATIESLSEMLKSGNT